LQTDQQQPRAATLEQRAELEAYARHIEGGAFPTELAHCDTCGGTWHAGYGERSRCSRCFPDDPPPLAEMLRDPEFWPGPRFVFALDRGPRGRWVLIGDYVTVKREDLRRLFARLPSSTDHLEITAAIGKRLDELEAMVETMDAPARERAEREAKRALELADRCQSLEDDLMRLRARCHELEEAARS